MQWDRASAPGRVGVASYVLVRYRDHVLHLDPTGDLVSRGQSTNSELRESHCPVV